MFLTVTANAALDRVIFIEEFRPGSMMRAPRVVDCVGGKGFDTSVALRGLQQPTVAVGFVAGYYGQRLAEILEGYGIETDLVWVDGNTRLANVLVETRYARHSHVMVGALPVTAAAIEDLLAHVYRHLAAATWVAVAGSLPPGVPATLYHTVTEMARAAGKPMLVDATGPPLRAALEARPDIVKMNLDEFIETFAVEGKELPELIAAARGVYARRKLATLVLTCGRDGVVAVTPEGIFHAQAPAQQAINAAGAGDAASAAILWRRSQGDQWRETMRWAAAVSAASVLTACTAEVHMADVERLLPAVTVETVE
ncbi:MAG: hexose kinase [Caldilineaceae bacterium]|nr:hexose kinase [Caldilineaceae bacterium]